MNESEYRDLTETAKSLPLRAHPSTVWRWCRKGVRVRGREERIKLRHVRMGRRILIKPEWLDAFMESLADADAAYFDSAPEAPSSTIRHDRSEAERARAVEAAKQRLGCRR